MSIADRVLTRILRLPAARNEHAAELGVQIPMRDGVLLRADHYAPVTAHPRGTAPVTRALCAHRPLHAVAGPAAYFFGCSIHHSVNWRACPELSRRSTHMLLYVRADEP